MLAARAASLQIELAAKEQENRQKLELKRLEDEELERVETIPITYYHSIAAQIKFWHSSDDVKQDSKPSENKKHTNTIIHASVEVNPSALQHSCVRHFIQIGDTNMRFQIPFIFLTKNKNKPKGNFWVYHIRFGLHESKNGPSSLEQLQKPFGSGYIGVTSRHPFVRLNEHYKKFRSGEGNLIHQQWRSLDDNNISHLMIFQITGRCETEEEMYDGEEKLVEVYSLTPKGFNMIPGGKNGIRFLEKHGFKNVNIENKEDFASTFLNIKKKTHYRKPHIREYKKDHFTFISGTWVNV